MTRQLKRTKAQARYHRKGVTHETGYHSGRGEAWNFLLVTGPEFAAYMRRHGSPDDFVRPVRQQFIHKGKKP